MKTTKFASLIAFALVIIGLLIIQPLLSTPAHAQVFVYTPTAESSGNIYYIVKAGDTCSTISLIYNVSIDQLRAYNQLDSNACNSLTVGKKLLIAIVPTPVITPGPSPTPTSSIPTPMPTKGQGTICIYLFNDTNGDAIVESNEKPLAGGEISIVSDPAGYSQTASSTGDGNPVCFSNIDEGKYNISVAVPDGYNPTTVQNYTVQLKAGDTSTIDFGAQPSSHLNVGEGGSGGSILLAVLGGLVLIAGVGIGVYAYLFIQKK